MYFVSDNVSSEMPRLSLDGDSEVGQESVVAGKVLSGWGMAACWLQ